jgi:hypothetical protein
MASSRGQKMPTSDASIIWNRLAKKERFPVSTVDKVEARILILITVEAIEHTTRPTVYPYLPT